jgi:hypothetical protein
MKDAGMYFVFGDYLDLSVTGDYFTLGSWAVNVNSRYMVKYKFNDYFAHRFHLGNGSYSGNYLITTKTIGRN